VPAARKLALLVRPALIAALERVFVWSDWSAIEARVTPWLAASPDAERVLDVFRANDADPTRPDIYTVAAADILHKDPSAVTKAERGIGEVCILACIAEGGADRYRVGADRKSNNDDARLGRYRLGLARRRHLQRS
jgi:hypothetical protein